MHLKFLESVTRQRLAIRYQFQSVKPNAMKINICDDLESFIESERFYIYTHILYARDTDLYLNETAYPHK